MPVGGLRHRFTTSSRGNAHAVPRSTEFCCWFGNSKVVNADDTPKLVYHGTVNDFEVFEETRKRQRAFGFHFGSISQAEYFAGYGYDGRGHTWSGGHIKPVYLRIESPLRTPDLYG